jgi:pSer/pThr/pTyr-binding forkhead associated (FHA) protein
LRVHGPSGEGALIEPRRPFALIGRAPGCDAVIDDHAVSPAHVYLHLDRRGLFAVDLATPGGSRIGPYQEPYAWLLPGDLIEIAGFRVELVALRVDDLGRAEAGDPGADFNPLFDIAGGPDVLLYPDGGGLPLVLRSQLIFAGRSEACGIRVDDPRVAPVQCVIVRGVDGVYLVDFSGSGTLIQNRPARAPAPLRDGDIVSIGTARFECRMSGALPAVCASWADAEEFRPEPEPRAAIAGPAGAAAETALQPSFSTPTQRAIERLGQEDPDAVLAWVLEALQSTHDELLRRQTEFQNDVLRALRKLQKQQTTVHSMQLERLEFLNHEVALLREEVRRRYGANALTPRAHAPSALPAAPPLPQRGSLVDETNAWLSRRIHHINQETRAARRAMLKK